MPWGPRGKLYIWFVLTANPILFLVVIDGNAMSNDLIQLLIGIHKPLCREYLK